MIETNENIRRIMAKIRICFRMSIHYSEIPGLSKIDNLGPSDTPEVSWDYLFNCDGVAKET